MPLSREGKAKSLHHLLSLSAQAAGSSKPLRGS
jgi:hypothetical protein